MTRVGRGSVTVGVMSLVMTAVTVTGCTSPDVPAVPAARVPSGSASARPSYRVAAPTTEAGGRREVSCRGRTTPVVGFGQVDAALGTRVLRVTLLNCSGRQLPVSRPVIAASRDGAPVPVRWLVDGTWQDPVVPPAGRWDVDLVWHSNGRRERGASRLDVTLGGARGSVTDCLQLGGQQAVTGEEDGVPVGRIRVVAG